MSSTTSGGNKHDWTKPAAMAIPKGGFQGKGGARRYGPIFPKNSGVLRLLDHREDHSRTGAGLL